ncbi:MAG: glycosyltransferase [Actinobacteria bacterium]|nr:glycosyltransferase [Actinomycetota bacterium]
MSRCRVQTGCQRCAQLARHSCDGALACEWGHRVVLTSDNEGIPLSLLEAASAGVAIVSLDVGGVGEIISDRTTGALVTDESQLASRLAELLDQPTLRRELAHAAQRDVRSRFTVEHYLAAHAAVYRRLVRSR